MNKETFEQVSFGLDLVHLAVHLGGSEPAVSEPAVSEPAVMDNVPAEAERLRETLRAMAVRKRASEPTE